ncbi:MAG TPA: peptide ABC transporter substrate-binding protein [Thermomicrobiaceae bacterium]|nr:peptide ABC transporter substrate-binding protein [Thermomicrobiaceae bacterium]
MSAVSLLLVGTMVLSGCGGSAKSPAATGAANTPASSAATEQATAKAIAAATGSPVVPQLQTVTELAPPVAQDGAHQQGALANASFTYQISQELISGDPDVDSYGEIYPLVFMPLLSLTPDNKIAQNAAESMQVSPDGKTYVFKLRKTTYSDGTPVKAADYAYGLQRACDPSVAGTYSSVLYGVVGCQKWRESGSDSGTPTDQSQLQQVVENSIKAVDDSTLQIQLQYPAGYFPYVVTLWIADPIRKDMVEKGGKDWWSNPDTYIGNGPFKVVKHTPNQEWVLEPNTYYPLGKPGISKFTFKIIQTPATALLAYQNGELDADGIDTAQFGQVKDDPTLKAQLLQLLNPSTFWIGLDVADPPFNNLKVRQAFQYAMNRQQYIQQINAGAGEPAGSLLYQGIPGYQTQFQQSYDPAKAKQLLSDAGYPDGKGFPTVQFDYDNSNDVRKNEAVFWSNQFKQILNVNIVPTPMDPVELGKLSNEKSDQIKMAIGVWYQDYPDAQDWLSLLFANNSGLSPRGWNDSHFNDLINQADALPVSQSASLYQQADAYLSENGPALFFEHSADLTLVKPYVKGYAAQSGQTYGFFYNLVFDPGAIYEVQH